MSNLILVNTFIPPLKIALVAGFLAHQPLAFAQSLEQMSLQELEAMDYGLRARTMSARMALMQSLLEVSERDFKTGGLTGCVNEGTARLEEIGESEQYAANSLAPGKLFLRDAPDRSDFATSIQTRKSVISRYGDAHKKLDACVTKNSR